MRLATVRYGEQICASVVDGQVARLTDLPDGLAAIRLAVTDPDAIGHRVTREVPLEDVQLLAPIPRPGKIFGSGINYESHKTENPAAVLPAEPGFFSKFSSSVVGPDAQIALPDADAQVDYEVELAVVIGAPGRRIARRDALGHVFGYTVINDVSARAIQFRPHQMDLGKGVDTFCPMGPLIVTADELADVGNVRVRSWVNGELRQDASTAEWLFGVDELVEHASRYSTLEPGDLITTGTPSGCGTFRNPPTWLAPGDDVVVEAEGIGRLRNQVVAGW
jgi:2-keto-4-pentenoate hydratase/2-oxohepta-3-ene-1,7-dioic acid hydratase in catechol pathway